MVAYSARLGDRQFCVANERRGPPFRKVWPPVMTADGGAVAYVAEDESGCFVVHRDARGPVFPWTGHVALSRDGSRVAYVAEVDASYRQAVVVDHRPGPAFQRVTPPAFSADGRVAAYGAFTDGRWRVVAGDRSIAADEAVVSVFLNADGSRIGCVTEAARGRRVVVEGRAGTPYDGIGWPMFAADGRAVYFGQRGSARLLVIGDREVPLGDCAVWDARIDGDRIVFSARQGAELWRKVVSLAPLKEGS